MTSPGEPPGEEFPGTEAGEESVAGRSAEQPADEADEEERWLDDQAGPLVRPFALTRGRARPDRHELTMITLVHAVRPVSATARLTRECAAIVRLCQSRPLSVAELAAELDMLVVVVKVLISDLLDDGYLVRQRPVQPTADEPDMRLLQAVLDGVRRI